MGKVVEAVPDSEGSGGKEEKGRQGEGGEGREGRGQYLGGGAGWGARDRLLGVYSKE